MKSGVVSAVQLQQLVQLAYGLTEGNMILVFHEEPFADQRCSTLAVLFLVVQVSSPAGVIKFGQFLGRSGKTMTFVRSFFSLLGAPVKGR